MVTQNSTAPVAVVTGSGRGIGRALVDALYARGYKVIAVVRSSADVDKLAAIDTQYVLPVLCDIAQSSAESILAEFLKANTKKIDLLVNNAGVNATGYGIDGLNFDELETNLAVHCFGAIRCVRASLPFLRRASKPLIVNMSSCHASLELVASGKTAHDQVTHSYKIAQAASNMVTVSLAAELQNENIRVLSFDPGPVRTRLGPTDSTTEPKDVAQAIIDLAENNIDTGLFLHINKEKIPW